MVCSICGKDCTNNYWEFGDEQDKCITRCPNCAVDYKDEKILNLEEQLVKYKRALKLACRRIPDYWEFFYNHKITYEDDFLDRATKEEVL